MKTPFLKITTTLGVLMLAGGAYAVAGNNWWQESRAAVLRLPPRSVVDTSRAVSARSATTPFESMIYNCSAIESQFGRSCTQESVEKLLMKSPAFASDVAKYLEATGKVDQYKGSVTDLYQIVNSAFAETNALDMKQFMWALLFEKNLLAKEGPEKKTDTFTDVVGGLKGKPKVGGGGSVQGSPYSGQILGAIPSSCLKQAKWKMPGMGGEGRGNSGGIGGGTGGGRGGPNDSPGHYHTSDYIEGQKASGKVDCTMFDPTGGNLDEEQGYDPDKANEAKNWGTWGETTGTATYHGTADDGSSVNGTTASVDHFQKIPLGPNNPAGANGGTAVNYTGTTYHHATTVTPPNGQGGTTTTTQTNTPTPPAQVPTPQGPVNTNAKPNPGSATGGMKPAEVNKPKEQKQKEKEKPKPKSKPKPKTKEGYTSPMDEGGSGEKQCNEMAKNAFKDCYLAELAKEYLKANDPECEKIEKTGLVVPVKCNTKFGASGVDQQQIFKKSGGGFTDPIKQQQNSAPVQTAPSADKQQNPGNPDASGQ